MVKSANMTWIMTKELLLSLFLFKLVCAQGPVAVFREEGSNLVMGYCFGADYIVIYRSTPDGDQLLGNSSNNNIPNTPPSDLQGRIHMNKEENLLGMHLDGLTGHDSGIYRRECWKNHSVVKNHTEQLFVCKEETSSEEIVVNDEGGAEIRCENPSVGTDGTFVHWYQELHPDYKSTLLLDSSISLEPVLEQMQGLVKAKENGALLILNKTVLKSFPQYYCLVFKGETCLGFQNIFFPDHSESIDIYVSKGERVILNCTGDIKQLQWETPLGHINSSSQRKHQMYISADQEPTNFSLTIPVISDELSGTYSCISPSFEIQYSVFLCPKSVPLERVASVGDTVSLECRTGLDSSKRVQWYRHVQAGPFKVIADTHDQSFSIQFDLIGRVNLSDSGLLTISNVDIKDDGMYKCVVLNEFLENAITEDYDYKEETTDEVEYNDEEYIEDVDRCFFKQEFIIKIRTRGNIRHGSGPTDRQNELSEGPHEGHSNTTTIAAIVGVLAFVAVVVIIIVIVKKKLFATNRETDHVEANNTDAGCTEHLTQENH